ncbi:MAG: thymidine kinase [Phycisphaerae bacterium]|jgi:thymidine kinase|nr:thymidine kinase [Phycisphaerae bacterium]
MADKTEHGRQGSLTVVTGCMFSGKSEFLVAQLQEVARQGRPLAAFKHSSDNRYGHRDIASHSGHRFKAVAVPDASRIAELAGTAEVVAVDEGQFFAGNLVDVCRELAAGGKRVIVAGLDLDSWGLPFGPMPELAQTADRVIRLQAVCVRCGRPADHTQRLTPIAGQKMVGGPDCYEPRCAACFEAPPIEMRC